MTQQAPHGNMYKDVIANFIKDEIVYNHLIPFMVVMFIINFVLSVVAFSIVQVYTPFHTPSR